MSEAATPYIQAATLLHPGCNPMVSQVLINGGPLAVREPRGGALVEAFYGGQAAGEGLAAVLYGEVNPAGRMPVTTYATEAQAGDIRSYDMTGGLGRTYRYLSTDAEPLYPFGYGLSYTRWRYSGLRASPTASVASVAASSSVASVASSSAARGMPGKGTACMYGEDDAVVLRLNLTNAGEVDGAEVASLYYIRFIMLHPLTVLHPLTRWRSSTSASALPLSRAPASPRTCPHGNSQTSRNSSSAQAATLCSRDCNPVYSRLQL